MKGEIINCAECGESFEVDSKHPLQLKKAESAEDWGQWNEMTTIFEEDRTKLFVIIVIISWIVTGLAFALSSFSNGLVVMLIVMAVDTMLLREKRKGREKIGLSR
jgi:hypothetical protein